MATKELQRPTIRRSDRDEDDYCHITEAARPSQTICGAKPGRRHGGETEVFIEEHYGSCPVCGNALCPACLQISRTYHRSGAWEGP